MPEMVFLFDTLEEQRRDGFLSVLLPLAKRVVELPDDRIVRFPAFGFNQYDPVLAFVAGIYLRLDAFCENVEFASHKVKARRVLPTANRQHQGIIAHEVPNQAQCVGAIQVLHLGVAHL